MSMQKIRDSYGVAWKRGDPVTYSGTSGKIVGARNMSLRVVLTDGANKERIIVHPRDPFLLISLRKGKRGGA
ncbi:MAG: hypothetical protein ACK52I_25460 [Pseudomonadota bacterium]